MHTNRLLNLPLHAALALPALITVALAQPADITFTTSENFRAGGKTFLDNNVVAANTTPTFHAIHTSPLSPIPVSADIDAWAVKNSLIYFSLAEDTRLGATVYADEDVLRWNGSTIILAWDGSANGLPSSVDLDALDIRSTVPFTFSFSLDTAAVLPVVGRVEDEDLLTWSGSAFDTIEFDGSARGIPATADLDGISKISNTRWLLSFNTDLRLGATVYEDADLIDFNPTTNVFAPTAYLDASARGIPAAVDIQDIEGNSNEPLFVDLARFTCRSNGVAQPVTVEWETGMEVDNVGFNVYRAILNASVVGDRLNAAVIPAIGAQGGVYTFNDPLPLTSDEEPRGYFLEDIDLLNRRTLHGPVWTFQPSNASRIEDWLLQ